MRALVRALLGYGLALGVGLGAVACTEQIELFPDQAPPDAASTDAASAEGGRGCVPAADPAGVLIPCVCKVACNTDSDCPGPVGSAGVRCDPATGLCVGNKGSCTTRADCTAHDPSTGASAQWLCISSK